MRYIKPDFGKFHGKLLRTVEAAYRTTVSTMQLLEPQFDKTFTACQFRVVRNFPMRGPVSWKVVTYDRLLQGFVIRCKPIADSPCIEAILYFNPEANLRSFPQIVNQAIGAVEEKKKKATEEIKRNTLTPQQQLELRLAAERLVSRYDTDAALVAAKTVERDEVVTRLASLDAEHRAAISQLQLQLDELRQSQQKDRRVVEHELADVDRDIERYSKRMDLTAYNEAKARLSAAADAPQFV